MTVVSLHKDKEYIVPQNDELVERARALIPTLRKNARVVEEAGRVPNDVMSNLGALDLLKVTKPARFGGYDLGPSALVQVAFELGRGCGSTAWCASIANCCAWYASFLTLEAQQDIWGKTPDALISSGGMPSGKAKAVEGGGGGYTTWGRWAYASNGDNADWFLNGSLIVGENGKPSRPAWFVMPKSDLKIDDGSWDVSGLQGTGSKTVYSDEPIFVPEHRVLMFEDLLSGDTPGMKITNNPLAAYMFSTFGGAALAAPILGMAQGALDVFIENMCSKLKSRFAAGTEAMPSAAESPFMQEKAGRAAVTISSALSYLLTVLKDAEATLRAGNKLTIDERIRIRSASTHASRQAVAAVNLLAECSGASAAGNSNPMQRYWRDVNTGARHMGLDDTAIYTIKGQHLFGLEPVGLF